MTEQEIQATVRATLARLGMNEGFATLQGAELAALYGNEGRNIPSPNWLCFHRPDCGIRWGYETDARPRPAGAVRIWTSDDGYAQRGQMWVQANAGNGGKG